MVYCRMILQLFAFTEEPCCRFFGRESMIARVIWIIVVIAVTLGASFFVAAGTLSDSAPAAPVKLIFIQHSCGEAARGRL